VRRRVLRGSALSGLLLAVGLTSALGNVREPAPARHSAAPHAAVPTERSLYHDAPNGLYLLDAGWTTRPDPHDRGARRGWQRLGATRGFHPVAIPNAFNARRLGRRSFNGSVQWYRTRFTAPPPKGAVDWRLRFESVNTAARVWLNGRFVGRHRGAYLPFELPAAGLRSGENELVVRVDSRARSTDLPPGNRARGWWNFGGILREVYLRRVTALDLSHLRLVAVPGEPARVQVSGDVRNASSEAQPLDYDLKVSGPDGFALAQRRSAGVLPARGRTRISDSFEIPKPRLWTPASPSLYDLRIALNGGQETRSHFGVRDWTVTADGIAQLNGRALSLRGASFHEQTRRRGAALMPADRDEIVRELQALGADFARQHYPPHPALLEAFDRAGIVYWEQIPVWRVRRTQLRSPAYRRRALSALRDAVLRDRNHASIMAWSVSNETLRGGAGEVKYLRAARKLLDALDPTRLFAADKALRPLSDLPPSYRILDAIGLNEYVGWYGGRNAQLSGNLATAHARFPGQALFVTELGAEANRAGPASRKGTYAFQRRFLAKHLGIITAAPFVNGALVWALRDFAARPGWDGGNPRPDPPLSFKGVFRQNGSPKPAARTVRRSFDAVPFAR
jgi:beta-glucuronidase